MGQGVALFGNAVGTHPVPGGYCKGKKNLAMFDDVDFSALLGKRKPADAPRRYLRGAQRKPQKICEGRSWATAIGWGEESTELNERPAAKAV
jgi:hypothetical protein